MSIEIDQIFEMLSWNNDKRTQQIGIEEAKKIKTLSIFFQPIESKSVWENCAKIISSKNDDELELYLLDLFKWLQDMNWPGSEIIYDRLLKMPRKNIEATFSLSMSIADHTNDSVWKQSLIDFYRQYNMS